MIWFRSSLKLSVDLVLRRTLSSESQHRYLTLCFPPLRSSCVLMKPLPAWTRRPTSCCNRPSGRSSRTRPSSPSHTGDSQDVQPNKLKESVTPAAAPPPSCSLFSQICLHLCVARINTIMDSDRVLVLHAGKVVEFDTPGALCQTDRSVFQRLVGQTEE